MSGAQNLLDTAEAKLRSSAGDRDEWIGALCVCNGQRGFIYTIFRDGIPLKELTRKEALDFCKVNSKTIIEKGARPSDGQSRDPEDVCFDRESCYEHDDREWAEART